MCTAVKVSTYIGASSNFSFFCINGKVGWNVSAHGRDVWDVGCEWVWLHSHAHAHAKAYLRCSSIRAHTHTRVQARLGYLSASRQCTMDLDLCGCRCVYYLARRSETARGS